MKIYKSKAHLRKYLKNLKETDSIGFVPTMGALHEGHMSLIRESNKKCDTTVCSIYVNPTQFNQPSDLLNYPKPLSKDLEMLKEAQCDIVFIPSTTAIYPGSMKSSLNVDVGQLGDILEARHRPGHFDGVMQVVKILLDIVEPDKLFLGLKDYQQLLILKRMIKYLNMNIKVEPCKIVREPDGLAMSSRNGRLSSEERTAALSLNQALFDLKSDFLKGKNWKRSQKKTIKRLNENKLISVEYLALANANNLKLLNDWNIRTRKRLLIAAFVGKIRLIDNIPL